MWQTYDATTLSSPTPTQNGTFTLTEDIKLREEVPIEVNRRSCGTSY